MRVGAQPEDSISSSHASIAESASQAVGTTPELFVREAAVPVDQGERTRPAAAVLVDDIG
jgi:hypothetical protein